MKVSVISSLFNCEKYVKKCLDSILNQTYADFEIILVDNASKDHTLEIARYYQSKHPQKIILYHTEEQLGAGGGRKKGLELAKGQYVCFVDADDFISPDYLQAMCSCAQKNDDPDIVMTGFQKISMSGKIKYTRSYSKETNALLQSVAPWAKMYKKDYLHKNQLTFRNAAFGEDVLFSTEVYLTSPRIALAPHAGYYWLENLTSTSHTQLRGFPKGAIQTSRQYFAYLMQKYPLEQEKLNYFIIKYCLWYLLQSGRGVPAGQMKCEYEKVLKMIHGLIPEWPNGHIWIPAADRLIVKVAVFGSTWLQRCGLLSKALRIYARLPMEKLWPSL